MAIDYKQLQAPFDPSDIEWRVQRCGLKGEKQWAMVLAYLTNRAIQQRLDDICGPENWHNEYKDGPNGGVLCGISIRVSDAWVTKWDGAENTNIEAVKGGLSDSMKRAAVQWGMGRYLYKLDATFVDVSSSKGAHYLRDEKQNVTGYWNDPKLPDWALPTAAPKAGTVTAEELDELRGLMEQANIHPDAIGARLTLIQTSKEAQSAIEKMQAKLSAKEES